MIEVVKNPRAIGAIAPTSRRLARAMVEAAGVATASQIIEIGAGAGAVTREIVRQKPRAAGVLAIERHSGLAAKLAARFPEVTVRAGCASRTPVLAEAAGFRDVEVIVSALPWTNFSAPWQKKLLGAACGVLRPGGFFTTFACLGPHRSKAGRQFRDILKSTFAMVETSPVIWTNLPPAFVYRCVK